MNNKEKFLVDAEAKAFDLNHRKTLNHNIGQYDKKVILGKQQFSKLEEARKAAKNIKWQTMEKLDMYLLEFERNFTRRGGKVIWAETAQEATNAILKIVAEKKIKKAVKMKSMVTEEIELNPALEQMGVQLLETDLGEYIVQLENSRPYHIITPIMQKSRHDVAKLFHEKFGTPSDASPEYLTNFVRETLREKFTTAELGITGGNFLVADTGSVVLTENEGNGRLAMGMPKTHIAIVGIEKMIPSINDLDLFLPLLSTYGTGQKVTVYNNIMSGPRQSEEINGPDEMYVILLNNGRTELLKQADKREALYCIRCGACLNACPIYKNVGGHTYETVYSGPIGAVLSPHLEGMEERGHLSEASSLCGNCTANCPVRIDLHKMLLTNRKDMKQVGLKEDETTMWKYWQKGMLSRSWMNFGFSSLKNFGFRMVFKKTWGKNRDLPKFPKKTFNELWKKGKV